MLSSIHWKTCHKSNSSVYAGSTKKLFACCKTTLPHPGLCPENNAAKMLSKRDRVKCVFLGLFVYLWSEGCRWPQPRLSSCWSDSESVLRSLWRLKLIYQPLTNLNKLPPIETMPHMTDNIQSVHRKDLNQVDQSYLWENSYTMFPLLYTFKSLDVQPFLLTPHSLHLIILLWWNKRSHDNRFLCHSVYWLS